MKTAIGSANEAAMGSATETAMGSGVGGEVVEKSTAVAGGASTAVTPVKAGVSSATKKGFGALLRASKSGELERVAATLPVDAAAAVVDAAPVVGVQERSRNGGPSSGVGGEVVEKGTAVAGGASTAVTDRKSVV